jgi:hypothetical protein
LGGLAGFSFGGSGQSEIRGISFPLGVVEHPSAEIACFLFGAAGGVLDDIPGIWNSFPFGVLGDRPTSVTTPTSILDQTGFLFGAAGRVLNDITGIWNSFPFGVLGDRPTSVASATSILRPPDGAKQRERERERESKSKQRESKSSSKSPARERKRNRERERVSIAKGSTEREGKTIYIG